MNTRQQYILAYRLARFYLTVPVGQYDRAVWYTFSCTSKGISLGIIQYALTSALLR